MEWFERFALGSVIYLLKLNSDHTPLLIRASSSFCRNCQHPFQFQAPWLTHHNFSSLIQKNWKLHIPLPVNIQLIGEVLTTWNKKVFGDIFRRKRKLGAQIAGV